MSEFEEDREEPTLRRIAREAARLTDMAEEQGISVGRILGRGSYGAVFHAETAREGACALKIPWVPGFGVDSHPDCVPQAHGPNRVGIVSPTGPFTLTAPDGFVEAAGLLESAGRTQLETGAGRPLPVLHRLVEIGGFPAALMEPVFGQTFRGVLRESTDRAVEELARIRGALRDLHEVFGPHGDLKPEHVICLNDETVFIDPLTINAPWIGSTGYALPPAALGWAFLEKNDAHGLSFRGMRDAAALAAMTAETFGGTLNWDGRTAYCIANLGNGRFSWGITLDDVRASMRSGTEDVPEPWRGWVRAVGDDFTRALFDGNGPALGGAWPAEALESFPTRERNRS